MKATIRLIMLTALRDRLFAALFVLLAVTVGLSIFLGATSVSEQLQVAVVFAAAIGRLVLVLGLTIFAAFHIQTLFETREIEAVLARSISRTQFVLSYWVGFVASAFVIASIFALAVISFAGWSVAALVWAASLVAECAIVLAVVLFAGLMLERATSTVLFTLGFYALARLMGFLAAIRETTTSSFLSNIVKISLDGVLLFIPRLDLFAQTQFLIYADSRLDGVFSFVQTALFLALILAASAFDLRRKQF
jgi:hypothetical protein